MRRLSSFRARRSLVEVLATFLELGKVSGPCLCVVGWRSLLATNELAVWLEMGGSTWRSFRHTGCLLSAFWAFPAMHLVYAQINVGGRMYGPPLMLSVVNMEIVRPHNYGAALTTTALGIFSVTHLS